MKVTVETKPLMSALAGATRIIERRASVPILSHVALEANGCLMLRATDMETAYETRIACETHAAGVATVDARTLLAVLKRSQPSSASGRGAAQTVTLEASDPPEGSDGASACADVRVAVNGTSARLVPASFPACFPTGAPRLRVTLPAAMLAEMIDATIYATSPDEARYNLSGVSFERAGNERIRMVATDGHRLALTERPFASERFAPFIIPRKLLAAVRTALGARPAGDVRMALRIDGAGAERSADGLAERPVISFRLADAESPCVLTTAGATDSPQAVIMPLRL